MTSPNTGFLFTAGKMDVPFFEDLAVLLHLEPNNLNTPVHVIGGWPSDPSQIDHGWTENTKNFFNQSNFDSTNKGFPGTSLANFRNGPDKHLYRPHVHKDWQRTIDLEFPVAWNATSREFINTEDKSINLLVMNAQAQLRGLDAEGAEIEFGAKFVGLPNINTQGLTRALADVASLDPDSIGKKLIDSLGTAVNQVALRDGSTALDKLLDDSLTSLVDAPLRAAINDPLRAASDPSAMAAQLDAFRQSLLAKYATSGIAAVRAEHGAEIVTGLQTVFQTDLLTATNASSSMIPQLKDRLDKADQMLAELQKLCNFAQPSVTGPASISAGNGPQPYLQAIARQAITRFLNSDFTTSGSNARRDAVNKLLKDLVEDAKPVLKQVNNSITEARAAILILRNSLDTQLGTRNLGKLLANSLTPVKTGTLATSTVDHFIQRLAVTEDSLRRLLTEATPAEFRQRFASVLIDDLRGSSVEAEMKKAINQLLTPVRTSAHGALNMLFGQVNNMVNQVALKLVGDYSGELGDNAAFTGLIADVNKTFSTATKAIGDFSKPYNDATAAASVLKFARATGYARTRGDSLDELRLDAGIGIAVPDEIGASVFVLIKNLRSDVPSTSCRAPGVVATEVTIGASGGVSIKNQSNGGPRPFKARLEGRFSFAQNLEPNGLDLLVDFETQIDIGALSLQQVQMRMGLGGAEAYATVAGRGSVWFLEVDGRLFLGSTRQLSILRDSLDPETYKTIVDPLALMQGNPNCLAQPVIGIYGQAGGYLSVNRFFGIPESCLINLKAGRHFSEYILISPQNPGTPHVGLRDALDIKGTILCIGVSGQAGLHFDVSANILAGGIGATLASVTGTARGWVEGCVDYYIGEACARADLIIGVMPNPSLVPPLFFYPIGFEY